MEIQGNNFVFYKKNLLYMLMNNSGSVAYYFESKSLIMHSKRTSDKKNHELNKLHNYSEYFI
jgi:hypothetical protein